VLRNAGRSIYQAILVGLFAVRVVIIPPKGAVNWNEESSNGGSENTLLQASVIAFIRIS
jgi:hypothetical protein